MANAVEVGIEMHIMHLSKIDRLVMVAKPKGLHLIGFQRWSKGWRAIYHSSKQAGRPPKLDECRDAIDYHYRVSEWLSRGKVYSEWHERFADMVIAEIKRLES